MPSSELYPLVQQWLQGLPGAPRRPVVAALAQLVTALLVGQSLRPSALMRTLLSDAAVPARQRYKRVARAWTRRWLSSAWLTPRLGPTVLALVAPERGGLSQLVLDGVRCGSWEGLVLGVVWHGRVLPLAWAVLAYPWPKGQFTPTACTLVRQVAAVWPAERAAHLVADRGFPSHALLLTVRQVGWGWPLRLRAKSWVTVQGQPQWGRTLLGRVSPQTWTTQGGSYGSGPRALPGTLVIGRGLAVLPWHQRDTASQQARAWQHTRRQQQLRSKHRRQRGREDASPQTDAWVVLFTSHPTWLSAVRSYGQRWAIEGSFRDAQGGWDGQHGWNLEPTLARLCTADAVERVVGLWALGTLLQTWLGAQVRAPAAPALVHTVCRAWTTTDRLSVWATGRLALTDPSGRLHPWLRHILTTGARGLTALAPPPPRPCAA